MVIDLSCFTNCSVDPQSRTTVVGPGVQAHTLRAATIAHGLHFPGGHISSVGISGFILGGGNGWGQRSCGAGCDNVLSMEVLTLDATEAATGAPCCRVRQVDEQQEPDLFAGLRGGGAFLGIALEFRLRLVEVPTHLPAMTATYPLELAQQVGNWFRSFHQTNPPSVEANLALFHASSSSSSARPGQPTAPVMAVCCVAFAELEGEVEEAYAKLRALLPEGRLSLQEGLQPYLQALAATDGGWQQPAEEYGGGGAGPPLCLYGHGMFVGIELLREEVLGLLRQATEEMTSPKSLILVCPSAPATPARTSLVWRDCLFVSLYAMWDRTQAGPGQDGDEEHVAWVRRFRSALGPHVLGLYLNEVMLDETGQVERSYDTPTYALLKALKAVHDPHSLLRSL